MRICLISMPMFSIKRGSIQLGILKAVLQDNGYEVDDRYLNISFAKVVGPELYEKASDCCDLLLGEWLFSADAFGQDLEGIYLDLNGESLAERLAIPVADVSPTLMAVRQGIVSTWLDEVASATNWNAYSVVGFSCTFSQTVASLALARRIKQRNPDVPIIFGGSSLDGEMGDEFAKNAQVVDCVIQGEGENAILEVLQRVVQGERLPRTYSSSKPTVMDEVPTPDYGSYFETVDDELAKAGAGLYVPLETSRGCWWGQKNHCTFCGLNGESMKFRSKSPERVLEEIDALSAAHHVYDFQSVDNILDVRYFRTVLRELASGKTSYRLFFETKANMGPRMLQDLADSGVIYIQPGIESIHSGVLELMNKGVSATENLCLLRNARQIGLRVTWNMLYGFPNERSEWYQEILETVPKMVHLEPPSGVGALRIDRFSPYFRHAVEKKSVRAPLVVSSKFVDIRPSDAYAYCYPQGWDVKKMAYFYVARAENSVSDATYAQLKNLVANWRRAWETSAERPQLLFKKGLRRGHVVDSRGDAREFFEIDGDFFSVAIALEKRPRSIEQLVVETNLTHGRVEEVIAGLESASLIIKPDNAWIWLPITERSLPVAPI